MSGRRFNAGTSCLFFTQPTGIRVVLNTILSELGHQTEFIGQGEAAPRFVFQFLQDRAVMHYQFGQELQRHFALQFVVTREPEQRCSGSGFSVPR